MFLLESDFCSVVFFLDKRFLAKQSYLIEIHLTFVLILMSFKFVDFYEYY